MDCRPPGSSAHGIFQARILDWFAISFSRISSHFPSPTCLYHTATWEASGLVFRRFKNVLGDCNVYLRLRITGLYNTLVKQGVPNLTCMEFTDPLLFLLVIYLSLALFYSFPPHHCDRQISYTFPHKDVRVLILGTREYVTLYSKRVFADVMKGFEMKILSWFIQAHPSIISRVLVNKRRREESLNLRRRCDDRSRGQWSWDAYFGDGGWTQAKEHWQTLEAEKTRNNSSLEPPERTEAWLTPGFQPSETHFDLWPQEWDEN